MLILSTSLPMATLRPNVFVQCPHTPPVSVHLVEPAIKLLSPLSHTPKCVFVRINAFGSSSEPQYATYVNRAYRLLCNMLLTKAPIASVEQSAPSKVLVLTSGDVSPTTMCQFEHTCLNYFIHKKIIVDDQVSLIMGNILDDRVGDWIVSNHTHILCLSFNTFMIKFCINYLAEDWEEDTLCELLSMTQGSSGIMPLCYSQKIPFSTAQHCTSWITNCIIKSGLVWTSGCQRRFLPRSWTRPWTSANGWMRWNAAMKDLVQIGKSMRGSPKRIERPHIARTIITMNPSLAVVIPWNGFIVECDELLTICYKTPYNTKSS